MSKVLGDIYFETPSIVLNCGICLGWDKRLRMVGKIQVPREAYCPLAQDTLSQKMFRIKITTDKQCL
jgi:hypothetical protein